MRGRRSFLLVGIFFMIIAFSFLYYGFLAPAVYGQEVIVEIGVVEGSVVQHTNFSETTTINNNTFIHDSYQSKFRAHNANLSFSKSFGPEGVKTEVTGVSGMMIIGKEVIGVEYVSQTDPLVNCGAAAGMAFHMKGVEYKSNATPGGLGACCGVNFSMESPQGDGRIEVASIHIGMDELTTTEGEEEKTTEVVFTNSYHKESVIINGVYNDFKVDVIAPVCVDAPPPGNPSFFPPFELCIAPMNPWGVTP